MALKQDIKKRGHNSLALPFGACESFNLPRFFFFGAGPGSPIFRVVKWAQPLSEFCGHKRPPKPRGHPRSRAQLFRSRSLNIRRSWPLGVPKAPGGRVFQEVANRVTTKLPQGCLKHMCVHKDNRCSGSGCLVCRT